MSRDLPSDLLTAISTNGTVTGIIALLAEFHFDEGTIGMWSGIGDIDYGGVTFSGGGNLTSVSPYVETQDLQAQGMSFTMSGVPTNLIAIAEDSNYQGRLVRLHIGLVDIISTITLESSAGAILLETGDYVLLESDVVAAYRLFSGVMNTMTIQETGDTALIQVQADNVLAQLKRSKVRRYTAQDQRSRYPADKGLDFIAQLQDKNLVW